MLLHIVNPAPVVSDLASGGFSRMPQDVAHQMDLTSLAQAITPIRSLIFEPSDGDGAASFQGFTVTIRTKNIVFGGGLHHPHIGNTRAAPSLSLF